MNAKTLQKQRPDRATQEAIRIPFEFLVDRSLQGLREHGVMVAPPTDEGTTFLRGAYGDCSTDSRNSTAD